MFQQTLPPAGAVTLPMLATQADQTFTANHSGGTASPTAETDATISKKIDSDYLLRTTGALREVASLNTITAINGTSLASGSSVYSAIALFKGDVVSSISFISGNTAWTGATGPIRFFCLRDASGNLLAKSADDGASAWAANAVKTLAMVTPYTVLTTGIYYIECVHSFGSGASNSFLSTHTVGTLAVQASRLPYQSGVQTGALTGGVPTDPLPLVATAAPQTRVYGYVS